jgi:hypothetical protein
MPAKTNATTVKSARNHSIDPALKAGIGATVCSVFIAALVLRAMHTL